MPLLMALSTVFNYLTLDPPPNRVLIAAMPPGTESVMIWKPRALIEESSVWKEGFKREETPPPADNDKEPPNLKGNLFRDIWAADPIVFLMGGSEFVVPIPSGDYEGPASIEHIGIGEGNYVERNITIVAKSLVAARRRLDDAVKAGEAKTFEIDGLKAYESRIAIYPGGPGRIKPIYETFFVSLLDDQIIVDAESKADLEYIIRSLKARKTDIPPQWATVAKKLDVEVPILILRKYNPTNPNDMYSPVNPTAPVEERIEIDSMGLVAPSLKESKLKLYVISKNGQKALGWFQGPPGGRNLSDIQLKDDGFEATVEYKKDEIDSENVVYLRLLLLIWFGVNVVI